MKIRFRPRTPRPRTPRPHLAGLPVPGAPSGRRRPPALLAAALALPFLLASCALDAQTTAGGEDLASRKIPAEVSPDTELTVGYPSLKVALELSGQIDELPFKVEWANISGGPQCSEAFRAGALDVCSAAEIPSINAHWTGLDTKLVAAAFREDPYANPIYELGTAPGAGIRSLEDLRGKKIAYSPGQAQGALVLRILDKAGLTQEDVELVELASTGDVYPTALGNRQVDAAPIADVNIKRYLKNYGGQGATTLKHGLRDDPSHLWALTESVTDPEKAAAVRELVKFWARAQIWIDRHPEEWVEGWYVKDQGLSREDGEYLVERAGTPVIPADWSGAIERQQKTVDLLAEEQDRERFDVRILFDRRFEKVGAQAVAAGDGGAS
ncbi:MULTISPECIES: ABC transporter substrate-binding protein [Streptomyces]|uniref:ABC transporter substrate-binding protein n=1 Tax=Streptomyces TaxID=1883 RepID=UPI001408E893|nr:MULTISPECIES: ABC transporter substrate-binding protein [Streptomyces]MDH6227204.1 sulfonate transport system substrate-binding protein [Streptomyces sp. MJP52]